MYSFADRGVGGGGVAQDRRKTQKLLQKVSYGKRALLIIHCIVVYVNSYSMGEA